MDTGNPTPKIAVNKVQESFDFKCLKLFGEKSQSRSAHFELVPIENGPC